MPVRQSHTPLRRRAGCVRFHAPVARHNKQLLDNNRVAFFTAQGDEARKLATLARDEDHVATQNFEDPLIAPARPAGEDGACEHEELRKITFRTRNDLDRGSHRCHLS